MEFRNVHAKNENRIRKLKNPRRCISIASLLHLGCISGEALGTKVDHEVDIVDATAKIKIVTWLKSETMFAYSHMAPKHCSVHSGGTQAF